MGKVTLFMRIRITGGQPIGGRYIPASNTNAAKALLAAALLTDHESVIRRVPRNESMMHLVDAARQFGVGLRWEGESDLHVTVQSLTSWVLDDDIVGGAVGSLLLLPALITRREHVRLEVTFPLSRIRTHLELLRDLGLDVVTMNGAVEFRAATWDIRRVILDRPSVTATAIGVLLAARLGQRTVIENAACEPHVTDLVRAVEMMGARAVGVGSNVLTIYGGDILSGLDATVGHDHIEIASVAAIAALSGGRMQIEPDGGRRLPDMRVIARTYERFGLNIDADEQGVLVPKHERFAVASREEDLDASVETAPYPGFPSDLVTVAAVIATQANGTSLIHEKLFRDRLLFVDTLKDMGAQIILADPHRAIVVGGRPLRGTYIPTPDPRFGLGMLGAALIAQGETVIDNAERFDYTFDGILTRLREAGANIAEEADE